MRHARPVRVEAGVAIDAGKLRVVRRNLVAIIAHGTIVRNPEPGVVESRAQPARRCVAGIARRWVVRRKVVRDSATQGLGAIPIREVAAVASCVRRGKRVVVGDMAKGACRTRQVVAGQRPAGRGVIKRSVDPGGRVVAGGALGGRVLQGHVVRHCAPECLRAVPIRGVAAVAVCGSQIVIAVDVARHTGCGG